MKKNPWIMLVVLLLVFGGIFTAIIGVSVSSFFGGDGAEVKVVKKNSIMHLKLDGIILDSGRFLKTLKKYREDKEIKAFVLEINSPGGVVGPSQEIFEELKRTRTEFEKPVVAVSTNLIASGAYYAAMGTDKLIVAKGALVGSIGVIMEFANLERLYDWAKISRYSINTGKYKDSGSEYRPMRDDERELFQSMIDEVWLQFKEAVAEGRNMRLDQVEPYADGRVMTGASAVKLGLADEVGTLDHAFDVAAKLAKVDDYNIFETPKKRRGFFDFMEDFSSDPEQDSLFKAFQKQILISIFGHQLAPELKNRPLFLMPGSW